MDNIVLDNQEVLEAITRSDGNLNLAAERLNNKHGLDHETISAKMIREHVASFDNATGDSMISKLRLLVVLDLYKLLNVASSLMMFKMDELRPSELARTHGTLMNSFTNLTQGAGKTAIDFDSELQALQNEFKDDPDFDIDEVRAGIKEIESKMKAKRTSKILG